MGNYISENFNGHTPFPNTNFCYVLVMLTIDEVSIGHCAARHELIRIDFDNAMP